LTLERVQEKGGGWQWESRRGRQADRKGVVGRDEETSRMRQAGGERQTGDTGRQGNGRRAAVQIKAQKQEDAQVGRQKWTGRQECRQMSREGIR
jgi:hypothetical protein